MRENDEKQRFEIWVDGELAGFTEHRGLGPVVKFVHTEIGERFGGKGLATQLIRQTLEIVRERGLQVYPYCPFVRDFIGKHPEYLDLVPADRRRSFDLPDSVGPSR